MNLSFPFTLLGHSASGLSITIYYISFFNHFDDFYGLKTVGFVVLSYNKYPKNCKLGNCLPQKIK